MRITIDGAGRVVIPKPMRESLGLTGGRTIEIREREGVIEIEPAAATMRLEERNGHLVAVPDRKLPPLTDDLVRATLEKTRRRCCPSMRVSSSPASQVEGSDAGHRGRPAGT